jgi:hypothetical protein
MLRDSTGSREANIMDQVKHIDVYESIISPCIKADFMIHDSIDLLNRFPIIGEETIEFTFNSPGGVERELKLSVYAIENQEADFAGKKKGYILRACSPEVLTSNGRLVNKKFNSQSSDIVKKILSDISGKKIAVEETKGIDEITITNLKPLQAIDFIRRRSLSPKYKSSSFCFYENREGFNFKTIEELFYEGRKNIGDKIFFYEQNLQEDIRTSQYRSIMAYEHVRVANSLETIGLGGMANKVVQYDLVTGEVKSRDYKDEEFVGADKKNNALNTNTFKNLFTEEMAETFFVPFDSSLPELDLPEKVGYLQSFVQKILQSMVRIHVNGDSNISVGEMLELNIPSFDGIDKKSDTSRLKSGNYLIAKVRHLITPGPNNVYSQSMELIKGNNT